VADGAKKRTVSRRTVVQVGSNPELNVIRKAVFRDFISSIFINHHQSSSIIINHHYSPFVPSSAHSCSILTVIIIVIIVFIARPNSHTSVLYLLFNGSPSYHKLPTIPYLLTASIIIIIIAHH